MGSLNVVKSAAKRITGILQCLAGGNPDVSITCLLISGFHKAIPEETLFKPCTHLDKLVSEGKLGMKTGEGFYTYEKKKK